MCLSHTAASPHPLPLPLRISRHPRVRIKTNLNAQRSVHGGPHPAVSLCQGSRAGPGPARWALPLVFLPETPFGGRPCHRLRYGTPAQGSGPRPVCLGLPGAPAPRAAVTTGWENRCRPERLGGRGPAWASLFPRHRHCPAAPRSAHSPWCESTTGVVIPAASVPRHGGRFRCFMSRGRHNSVHITSLRFQVLKSTSDPEVAAPWARAPSVTKPAASPARLPPRLAPRGAVPPAETSVPGPRRDRTRVSGKQGLLSPSAAVLWSPPQAARPARHQHAGGERGGVQRGRPAAQPPGEARPGAVRPAGDGGALQARLRVLEPLAHVRAPPEPGPSAPERCVSVRGLC